MSSKCEHCGKTRFQFDHAWDTPKCLRPEIFDPAVGGWVCKYKPPQEGDKPLVAQRVEVLICPVCRQSHNEGAFKDGSLMCSGCSNTIRAPEACNEN